MPLAALVSSLDSLAPPGRGALDTTAAESDVYLPADSR
jgi:hypothetical protein